MLTQSNFLFAFWRLEEGDARKLLSAAGMSFELACDAWMEAGERLIKGRAASYAIPRAERLALATKYARERR